LTLSTSLSFCFLNLFLGFSILFLGPGYVFFFFVFFFPFILLSGFLCLLERSHKARSFAINKRGVLLDGMGPRKSAIGSKDYGRMGRTNGIRIILIPHSSTKKMSQLRRRVQWTDGPTGEGDRCIIKVFPKDRLLRLVSVLVRL
jgi:hypothetical protein